MLLKYPGFLALLLFSIETLAIAGLLWRLTGFLFFRRWLLRLSWILPLYSIIAFRIYETSLDPQTIRTFLDYQRFLARSLVRDSEILAAHYLPILTTGICVLIMVLHLRKRFNHWMGKTNPTEVVPL